MSIGLQIDGNVGLKKCIASNANYLDIVKLDHHSLIGCTDLNTKARNHRATEENMSIFIEMTKEGKAMKG